MKSVKPIKKEHKNAKVHGNPLRELIYIAPKNKPFTREDIEENVDRINRELAKGGFKGQMSVLLWYEDEQKWFSEKFVDVGQPIPLFSFGASYDVPELDPESHKKVIIQITKYNKNEGGCTSPNTFGLSGNNCLYECLLKVVPNLKDYYPTPARLKYELKLGVDEKISIDKIKIIEDTLKDYRINVSGEYKYISTKKAKYDIYLTLANEHYEINSKQMWDNWGVAGEEKIPLVYKHSKKDATKVLISPRIPGMPDKWDIETFLRERNNYITSRFCFVKCEKDKTMKQTYIDFITNADILKEATKGRINLYKTGGNLKIWSLELFRQLTKNIQPEPIQPDEAEWLENAKCGQLLWAKNGYKGKAYKKDMVSMYPYILSNKKFMIPIKRGEFKKITKNEFDKMDYYNFGIYRVKITGSDYRIFRYNKSNYYTHYDLTVAKKRGYKMELILDDLAPEQGSEAISPHIADDKPNCLIYGKDCRINGDVMFKQFVDYLFPLKKQKVEGAKKILTTIWGAMIEKDRIKKYVDPNKSIDVRSNDILEKYLPLDLEKGQYMANILKREKIYLSNFARIGPFILACGRKLIGDILYPHLDNVVRLNTDGFLINKNIDFTNKRTKWNTALDSIKEGTDIGDLRNEGYCEYIEIINCNNVIDKNGNKLIGKDSDKFWT